MKPTENYQEIEREKQRQMLMEAYENGRVNQMSVEPKSQNTADAMCLEAIRDTLQKLRGAKPDDRSELARRYAVTITEIEKAQAYFWSYVISAGVLD